MSHRELSPSQKAFFAVVFAVVACSDVELTVNHAPGYVARSMRLSVLGVFKNGRMDATAWDEWATTISSAMGTGPCSPAFDDRMESAKPALYESLDEGTRQDGITDGILDSVGASAEGDALLVIEAFGRPPKEVASADATSQPSAPPPQPSMGRGRGRGRGSVPTAGPARSAPEQPKFEASVGVYSLKTHEIAASVQVRYDGADSKDAQAEFAQKLRLALGGATCAGWAWQDEPDGGAPASPRSSGAE